jgi:hypothetical protein
MKQSRSRRNNFGSGIAFLALLFLCQSLCVAQTAAAQITAENAHLKQALPTLGLSATDTAAYAQQLKLIDTATQSGNLFQGMYYLQRARVELMTFEYVQSKADVEKQGTAAFENEWRRVGQELAMKERLLATKTNLSLPAAVKAMVESSLTQVQPYYQSSRLYGRNTTIGDGLYYLGVAPANLDFALFCQQLKFEKPKSAPKLGSIETEISALEAAAVKAFQDPDNTEKQRAFIQISSTLKMARELNEEKRFAGALKTYLDALLDFGLVRASAPDAERSAELKKEAAKFRTLFSSSPTDQTIGLIYIEMALAADGDLGLQRAAVIVEKLLPSYLKSLSEIK